MFLSKIFNSISALRCSQSVGFSLHQNRSVTKEPNSRVHYVNKITFVGSLWRLANQYIFEKLITSGIRKPMFTFVQKPVWPPFWVFKMAAAKYEFLNISGFY